MHYDAALPAETFRDTFCNSFLMLPAILSLAICVMLATGYRIDEYKVAEMIKEDFPVKGKPFGIVRPDFALIGCQLSVIPTGICILTALAKSGSASKASTASSAPALAITLPHGSTAMEFA